MIKTFETYNKPNIKKKYYKNGQLKSEIYSLNDKYHREDGPAVQYWYENGQLKYESYWLNSKLYREDGPAYQYWYDTGKLKSEEYYLNGKWHREDGPAYQYWYENGQLKSERYYLNGNKCYTQEEFVKKLKEINSPHYEEQLLKLQANKYNL